MLQTHEEECFGQSYRPELTIMRFDLRASFVLALYRLAALSLQCFTLPFRYGFSTSQPSLLITGIIHDKMYNA